MVPGVGVVGAGVVGEVVVADPPVLEPVAGLVGVPKYQAVPVVDEVVPLGVVVAIGPPPSEKDPPEAVRV